VRQGTFKRFKKLKVLVESTKLSSSTPSKSSLDYRLTEQTFHRKNSAPSSSRPAQDLRLGERLGTGLGGYFAQQSAPALTSFYQQPMYAGSFGGQAAQNAMMAQQQAGPQYFNPESQTGMGSIYGAYNSQMQYAAGMAQANAAKSAGKMGMIGSLGGAVIGAGGMLGGAAIL